MTAKKMERKLEEKKIRIGKLSVSMPEAMGKNGGEWIRYYDIVISKEGFIIKDMIDGAMGKATQGQIRRAKPVDFKKTFKDR